MEPFQGTTQYRISILNEHGEVLFSQDGPLQFEGPTHTIVRSRFIITTFPIKGAGVYSIRCAMVEGGMEVTDSENSHQVFVSFAFDGTNVTPESLPSSM
jgi:hypothetical protein